MMGQGEGYDVLVPLAELVPKPTVNAKVIRSDPEQCEATLECSVRLEAVTYEWISHSKFQWNRISASELHVFLNSSPDTYTCKVSNPVSSNNASLIYRHPCSWTGTADRAESGGWAARWPWLWSIP